MDKAKNKDYWIIEPFCIRTQPFLIYGNDKFALIRIENVGIAGNTSTEDKNISIRIEGVPDDPSAIIIKLDYSIWCPRCEMPITPLTIKGDDLCPRCNLVL